MTPENQHEEPLTFSRFVKFYQDHIEPRFERIESKLESHDHKFAQFDTRFDDLYKTIESFRQELLISSFQIQRLTNGFDIFRFTFAEINKKLGQLD